MTPGFARFFASPVPVGLFLLVAGSSACAGGSRVELEKPLPFRVALMPVQVEEGDLTAVTAVTPAAYPKDEPRFQLTEEDLTRSLLTTLDRRGFASVEVLSYPADSSAFMALDATGRMEYWMREASRTKADLLLRIRVTHEPNLEGDTNEKFWLNLPLFLLGGPFCYFINDRTYVANAELLADFFSVASGPDEDRSAIFSAPLKAQFSGSQLDFTDRAEGAGTYALSLICPAGLLARKSDRIVTEVTEDALDSLAEALLNQVAIRKPNFLRNPRLCNFSLDDEKSSARRSGQGVSLVAAVEDDGNGLMSYRVLGGGVASAPVDLSGERTLQHLIRCEFALPDSENSIQLEVQDSRQRTRSFTFLVQ